MWMGAADQGAKHHPGPGEIPSHSVGRPLVVSFYTPACPCIPAILLPINELVFVSVPPIAGGPSTHAAWLCLRPADRDAVVACSLMTG